MTQARTPADDPLLRELEKGIRDVLGNKDTKTADRLKAIEIGAKLLAIRHRLEGGGGDGHGSFFDRSGS